MRILTAALIAAGIVHAGEPVVMNLWPDSGPSTAVTETGPDGERRTRGVNQPRITVFLPDPAAANGTAVIVAPGGGYRHLTIDKEGQGVAKWLATIGVAGILLDYRVQPLGVSAGQAKLMRPQVEAKALEDARRAMLLVKENARKWRIDPARIGFMGFSAGGNLGLNLGQTFDPETRPAFLSIFYAGPSDGSAAFPVNTPPVFLVCAYDDPAVTRVLDTLANLKKAKIPAEAHIYSKGGHGFGISKKNLPVDSWPERMREWMDANGWLRRMSQ